MATDIEKMVKNYLAAVNSHDVDKILSFFTDDCVYEDVAVGKLNRGKQEVKAFVNRWYVLSHDLNFELTSVFSAGDWAATEWIMSGTHTGEVLGIPATNKRFSLRGATIIELRTGRISRNSDYWNLASFLQQIGILPAAPPN